MKRVCLRYLWTESIDKSFEKFLQEGARDLVDGFEEEGGHRFRSLGCAGELIFIFLCMLWEA